MEGSRWQEQKVGAQLSLLLSAPRGGLCPARVFTRGPRLAVLNKDLGRWSATSVLSGFAQEEGGEAEGSPASLTNKL